MTDLIHPDIRRTLLFLKRGDEVLLALKKRGHGEGKWNGVGGKIEPGETIEQAMVRECREEIGVRPMNWRPVAELDFVQDADREASWHMYAYVFIAEEWEGEIAESEEMMPKWFEIHKIPYGSMWDDDELWLPQALRDQKITGEFTFDGEEKLLTHSLRVVEELPYERNEA